MSLTQCQIAQLKASNTIVLELLKHIAIKLWSNHWLSLFQLLNKLGNKMSKLKLWAGSMWLWYHVMGIAHSGGVTPWNHSCIIMITLREVMALSMSHLHWSRRYEIKQTMCHSHMSKSSTNPGSLSKKLTLLQQWEEQALAVNGQNPTSKDRF